MEVHFDLVSRRTDRRDRRDQRERPDSEAVRGRPVSGSCERAGGTGRSGSIWPERVQLDRKTGIGEVGTVET